MLFFTTSPRTPSKMIPEIKILTENFTEKKWDKKTQCEFIDFLTDTDFFEGKGSSDNKDLSARDRINRAPKALGFVDLNPIIKITPAGNELVYGKRPQEIFLRQLLKFQLPSPYHKEPKNTNISFYIRPYLEIIRLIKDLDSLSFDELKMFGLKLIDYRQYDNIKKEILQFRIDKEKNKGQYKRFADNLWTNILLQLYKDNIKSGNTKTRESKDKSLKNFITTKKRNARDYADACFRYLRYTGLFSISHKNCSISIYPDRMKEIDYILESIERNPIYIEDEYEYKNHLFNAHEPKLYDDNRENVIDHILRISDYTRKQIEQRDIEQLKDLRDDIIQENKDSIIKKQKDKIKSYALYSEIIDTYNEIISNNLYDIPLMFEYNTWRAMTMLDGGEIEGHFKFDDAGQPLSTAPGNMPDIECFYDDFVLSVEVTMQQGQRQYESEGEPVARHYGQMRKRTGKDAYCIFIAPTINKACLAHFYALNKIGISYYGGKTKIIPIELDQFMKLVENSYNYPTQPSPRDIRSLLDEIIISEELSKDEIDWNNKIQLAVNKWLVL